MLESMQNVVIFCFGLVSLFFFCGIFFFSLAEHSMGNGAHLSGQHTVNHELVRARGVSVLDHLGRFLIKVRVVSRVILDRLLGVYKLTDVYTGGAGLLFKEIGQLLKVFVQVLGAFN